MHDGVAVRLQFETALAEDSVQDDAPLSDATDVEVAGVDSAFATDVACPAVGQDTQLWTTDINVDVGRQVVAVDLGVFLVGHAECESTTVYIVADEVEGGRIALYTDVCGTLGNVYVEAGDIGDLEKVLMNGQVAPDDVLPDGGRLPARLNGVIAVLAVFLSTVS